MAVFRKAKKVALKILAPLGILVFLLAIREKIKNNETEKNQINFDQHQTIRNTLNKLVEETQSQGKQIGNKFDENENEDFANILKNEAFENKDELHFQLGDAKDTTTEAFLATTLYGKDGHEDKQNEENKEDLQIDQSSMQKNDGVIQIADIIYDYEAINNLKHYAFKMRSSDPNVTQRYLGGSTVNTIKEKCYNITYDLKVLPTAAVVISFHENERVESILHTIHSIYENSPPEILQEIILIDDFSKKASHKGPLESYIHDHFPEGLVIIHRHEGPENLGLIQGRLLGIKMATSKVIVVMDAHMEVQPKWLEPLVQAIYDQRNIMATSQLDWMRPLDSDPNLWYYDHGSPIAKTTWVWKSFNFGFRGARRLDLDDFNTVKPIDTPMSVGTIWAMDKDFFFEIGGFDNNMVLWGGENIDLPIRVHLCSGGRVVNIPCSKASHQEIRHQRDYRTGWREKFLINFRRIAEVWLDGEYKETFYFYNEPLLQIDPGDLTERLKLKAEKCPRSFGYYLANAFPEMGVDAHSFGWKGMINMKYKRCFYYSPDNGILRLAACSFKQPKEQGIFLSYNGHLRQYLSVFDLKASIRRDHVGEYIISRQDYYYTYNNREIHTKYVHTREGCLFAYKLGLCLGATDDNYLRGIRCNGTCDDPSLQWRFRKYTHYYKEIWEGNLMYNKSISTLHNYYQTFRDYMLPREEKISPNDILESETIFRNYVLKPGYSAQMGSKVNASKLSIETVQERENLQ